MSSTKLQPQCPCKIYKLSFRPPLPPHNYLIVLSTSSLYIALTSSTSALNSSTSSLFSPSSSSVVSYRSFTSLTSPSNTPTLFTAALFSSTFFIIATISALASSLCFEILDNSSFAATFSDSSLLIAALILSTN